MPNVGPLISLREIVGDRPLFVTRTWGFDPGTWAGVCFPYEKTVEKWTAQCPQGGFVMWFASHHHQDEVPEQDRGRVFGLYEFIPELISYTDPTVIHPDHLKHQHNYRADGGFRWPFGLRGVRAWEYIRPDVMTGGTLPDARSLGLEATTDMVPMTARDVGLANQTLMREIPVFHRDFRPPQLRPPNAVPSFNYLFVCKDVGILKRIPGWMYGDVLIKPGIAFDVQKRLEFINTHAVARVFGLQMTREFEEPAPSFRHAVERERSMLASAKSLGCRVAGTGQQEFMFGREKVIPAVFAAGKRS